MAEARVPGLDPNTDVSLTKGQWAEHKDGSIVYVKDVDKDSQIIFNLYDLTKGHKATFGLASLSLKDFETIFTYNPAIIDKVNLKWIWHTDIPMPWDKILEYTDYPESEDTFPTKPSAAYKTLEFLNTKGACLTVDDIIKDQTEVSDKTTGISGELIPGMEEFHLTNEPKKKKGFAIGIATAAAVVAVVILIWVLCWVTGINTP